MSISNLCNINALPSETFTCVLSFLDGRNLCKTERVCVSWKKQIDSPDQYIWYQPCVTLQIPIFGKEVARTLSDNEPEISFNLRIISIITGYLEDLKSTVVQKEKRPVSHLLSSGQVNTYSKDLKNNKACVQIRYLIMPPIGLGTDII